MIDRNYDINDVVTANLAKSRELHRNSGHSPDLPYKTLIYIVIPVIDQNYDENDAMTDNIHLVVPVTTLICMYDSHYINKYIYDI